MIEHAYQRERLSEYVEALRTNLEAGRLQDAAAAAAEQVPGEGPPSKKLAEALPSVPETPASSGGANGMVPYLARDPMISLFQSSLHEELRKQGVPDGEPGHRRGLWARTVHKLQAFLHPVRYGPSDDDWVIKVGGAMLDRLSKGNRPFNPQPAVHDTSDTARIVIVGDWGTGLPRACDVARYMAEEVAGALAERREAHVVHLGDVYYSGLPEEVKRNVLGHWPVTPEQAQAGVTSWSLNGNHDMYGGGYGYFDTLLMDPRFAAQRSPGGAPTSYFRLRSPSWDFVGLDTSWDDDVLSMGQAGVLHDPQAKFVADVAAESARKLVLLSHHQLVTLYADDDISPVLGAKLGPVLQSGRVTAWFWGHEHRCMGFEPQQGVEYPRCVGHGGVPVLMTESGKPKPPGLWQDTGFLEFRGDRWARFGFAILDLSPNEIKVRYRNDLGEPTDPVETIA